MKVGDRVTKSPMWKYGIAVGKVIKIKNGYIVVRWEGINGEWHYTPEQAESLRKIE